MTLGPGPEAGPEVQPGPAPESDLVPDLGRGRDGGTRNYLVY